MAITARAKKLTEFINSRHPSYDPVTWNLCWDAYLGGKHFTTPVYLQSHPRESVEVFNYRCRRAYYPNYIKPLVRIIVASIFRADDIEREGGDDDFAKNVDKRGTAINQFMSEVALRAVVRGVHYVGVDNYSPDDMEIRSLAQERAAGVGPYWYHIDRDAMINWELDPFGDPLWCLFRESETADTDPVTGAATRGKTASFILWERDGWARIKAKQEFGKYSGATVEESGPNDLGGIIPVVAVYGDKLDDWDGDSMIVDAAYIARNLLNVCSLRDEHNFESAIALLCFPGMDPDAAANIVKSPAHILSTPGDATSPPSFLEPSGRAAEILRNQIVDHKETIYHLMSQRIINSSALSDGASGESKQQDFMATNTALADIADEMERAENALHALSALWMGQTEPDITVTYPNDFDFAALDKAIQRAIEITTLDVPDELREFLVKSIVRKLPAAHMDDDEREELEDAIEAHYAAEPEQPARLPEISDGQGSPDDEGTPTQGGQSAAMTQEMNDADSMDDEAQPRGGRRWRR